MKSSAVDDLSWLNGVRRDQHLDSIPAAVDDQCASEGTTQHEQQGKRGQRGTSIAGRDGQPTLLRGRLSPGECGHVETPIGGRSSWRRRAAGRLDTCG